MNRVQKLIQTGVRCVYIIMIFIILANVLFGQNIDYSFKKDFPIHMAGYLLLGGIGIIGGYVLIMFLLGKLKKDLRGCVRYRFRGVLWLLSAE